MRWDASNWREYLRVHRLLTDESVDRFGLTWEVAYNGWISGIVFPMEGGLKKLYNPNHDPDAKGDDYRPKMIWVVKPEEGKTPPPWPSWAALYESDVICEGELDTALLLQHGIAAATGTTGAGGFSPEYAAVASNSVKTLLFDHDAPGYFGMVGGTEYRINPMRDYAVEEHEHVGAARMIVEGGGFRPKIARWPANKAKGYDVTQWFRDGGTIDGLRVEVLDLATEWRPTEESVLNEPGTPEDQAAERDLIGACVLGGTTTFVQVQTMLRPADFTSALAGRAWLAMQGLQGAGEPIDVSTVRSALERDGGGGTPGTWLIEAIEGVPTSSHAEAYAKVIRMVALRRATLVLSERLVHTAKSGDRDEATYLSDVQRQFADVLAVHSGSTTVKDGAALAREYAEVIVKREAEDPDFIGIGTGFVDLDKVMALRPGETCLIAGSPGTGKTAFLKEMQMSLARRSIPSLLVSLEQPSVQIMDRLVAGISEINSWKILHPKKMSMAEMSKVWDAVGQIEKMSPYIHVVEADGAMTTARLEALVRQVRAKHDIRVVFVDYLTMLQDDVGRGASQNERVGHISQRLTAIAAQCHVSMVVASQLSRAGSQPGQMPDLHHLRQSGELEANAFIVLFMVRAIGGNDVQIKIAKNRNGQAGDIVNLFFDPTLTRFYSAARPPQGEGPQHGSPKVTVVQPTLYALEGGKAGPAQSHTEGFSGSALGPEEDDDPGDPAF